MEDPLVKVLGPGDEGVLLRAAEGVFDDPVDPALAREFLAQEGHLIAVAIVQGKVVGFASGVRYIHPDKPWALWVNEVGVAPAHQRRGIGTAVLRALLDGARRSGCREAWVGTGRCNEAALGLYRSLGGHRSEEEFVEMHFRLDSSP